MVQREKHIWQTTKAIILVSYNSRWVIRRIGSTVRRKGRVYLINFVWCERWFERWFIHVRWKVGGHIWQCTTGRYDELVKWKVQVRRGKSSKCALCIRPKWNSNVLTSRHVSGHGSTSLTPAPGTPSARRLGRQWLWPPSVVTTT